MDRKKRIVIAACSLILGILLCLALYHFDNKYTHTAAQPIGGVLILSEQDIADTPIHYLTRQWEFYPGKLLSPGETEGEYRHYTDIVSSKDFAAYESGTYRLRIVLPDEPRDYAIELPEVFSACRLFIDGRERLLLGEPNTNSYKEGIGSRVVLFTAAGNVELLLNVSNKTALYSGLTYPPAFGEPDTVMASREAKMLVHGIFIVLALFGALLSVSLAMQENRLQGILMLLICLCLAVTTGYPLYHGTFITGYLPLYPLELSCIYALLFLSVLLCGRLFGLPKKWRFALSVPCAIGVLCAIMRGFAVSLWSSDAAYVFEAISLLLKYYAAALLLGISIWALLRQKKAALPILCGAIGFCVCLAFDRLLPLYEPIIGGWYTELGGVILVFSLAFSSWLYTLEAYSFRNAYATSLAQMEHQLTLQKEHYRQMSEQLERSRAQNHDFRHHANAIVQLAEQENNSEIIDYLSDYKSHLSQDAVSTYSDLLVADAVLRHYEIIAKAVGAIYDVALSFPKDLAFPSDELCVMLSNLLENATEAMARQKHGQRQLYLRGGVDGTDLFLMVHNSFSGKVQKRGEEFLSSKSEGFGLGIRSVQRITENHGGLCGFLVDGDLFKVSVLIPLVLNSSSN